MPLPTPRVTALAVVCLAVLTASSCSSHHARLTPAPTMTSPTRPSLVGDVALAVRYVELRSTAGIDPAFSFVYPTDLAVVTRASACRAWQVSPSKNERSQVEIHLKIPAASVVSATTVLRSRVPVLTAHTEPPSALTSTPTAYTAGVPGLPEALTCEVIRRR